MARSFILYLIGAFLFPNSAQSMTTVWLVALEDLEICSQFAWGQAVLSYLYTSMDSLSRDQISSITGCWRLWAVNLLPLLCSSLASILYSDARQYF